MPFLWKIVAKFKLLTKYSTFLVKQSIAKLFMRNCYNSKLKTGYEKENDVELTIKPNKLQIKNY